jgi:ribosomal protein S4
MTTIEVKKRVLRSAPHMGAKNLKLMVRKHARKGNKNSFLADFESRLDRFLWRCNVVPSVFAARMVSAQSARK